MPEHWVLRPWPEQHREGYIRARLRRPSHSAFLGGRSVARRGVEYTLSAPGLGDAAAPSHFPLGPLLAFQAAEFSIVNLETKNKPAGRGGSGEVTGATAPEVCSGKAPPHAAPPTNHAPSTMPCPGRDLGVW